jgi:hypothetical protein
MVMMRPTKMKSKSDDGYVSGASLLPEYNCVIIMKSTLEHRGCAEEVDWQAVVEVTNNVEEGKKKMYELPALPLPVAMDHQNKRDIQESKSSTKTSNDRFPRCYGTNQP